MASAQRRRRSPDAPSTCNVSRAGIHSAAGPPGRCRRAATGPGVVSSRAVQPPTRITSPTIPRPALSPVVKLATRTRVMGGFAPRTVISGLAVVVDVRVSNPQPTVWLTVALPIELPSLQPRHFDAVHGTHTCKSRGCRVRRRQASVEPNFHSLLPRGTIHRARGIFAFAFTAVHCNALRTAGPRPTKKPRRPLGPPGLHRPKNAEHSAWRTCGKNTCAVKHGRRPDFRARREDQALPIAGYIRHAGTTCVASGNVRRRTMPCIVASSLHSHFCARPGTPSSNPA